jgi:hypothetical protein
MNHISTFVRIILSIFILLAAGLEIAGDNRFISAAILIFCVFLFWFAKGMKKIQWLAKLRTDIYLGAVCLLAVVRLVIVFVFPSFFTW